MILVPFNDIVEIVIPTIKCIFEEELKNIIAFVVYYQLLYTFLSTTLKFSYITSLAPDVRSFIKLNKFVKISK